MQQGLRTGRPPGPPREGKKRGCRRSAWGARV